MCIKLQLRVDLQFMTDENLEKSLNISLVILKSTFLNSRFRIKFMVSKLERKLLLLFIFSRCPCNWIRKKFCCEDIFLDLKS